MTPEELLYEMTYENEKQRAEAEKYIALKVLCNIDES